MPDDAWLQMKRKAAMATTGAPRSSQSWRTCTRGSSPRNIATMGFRNPRPTNDNTRMTASTPALMRGNLGLSAFGPGLAEAAESGAAAGEAGVGTAASAGFTLLADDIAVLDFLLALQSDRELLDVGVRLAAVILDAVDELLRGWAETVGGEIEVGSVRLLLRDQRL